MERLRVRPLELIVYHSINTERSIPTKRRAHDIPLDDVLMVVADDSLLPALAPVLALGPTPDALLDPEELPMTARCPEISVNKK